MISSLIFAILSFLLAVMSTSMPIVGICFFLCGGFTTFYILELQDRIKNKNDKR